MISGWVKLDGAMGRGHNFGTFGGVFTPSILTILGVIMYLRLPWIVGTGGLLLTATIILLAHVISITTGLSVSSIATDKSVQAGGPYYIISRSLGLPLGGTLGLALFIGLSFSISLYVIGFSESLLEYLGYEVSPEMIRICGSITLVALTIVTFVSTALAIKTQYLILGAIILSLISIVFGPGGGGGSGLEFNSSGEGAPDAAVLFGIFFPAVTGFTAGVNLSGDLRDPRKAIPRGTLASIATGLLVYLVLAAFLAYTVPADELANNPSILLDISFSPILVVAGIWGATISSALGSILGAPRILQALSLDRVTTRFFSRGYGPTNEPRNALLLTFLIAEGGILIAELDIIARLVSMFFIATYGFLNFSCAVESWASPDFRPEFKIPRWVSLLGLFTCGAVMFQLDFLAMAGSVILLGLVFAVLKRRELTLESGDTWEGVWSSVVRTGLHYLFTEDAHHRNWRPNILAFSKTADSSRSALVEFGQSLIAGRGVLTDVELTHGKGESVERKDLPVGVFHRATPTSNLFDTMSAVCRYHGLGGMQPNTVLLDWDYREHDRKRFVQFMDELRTSDFNVLLYAHDRQRGYGNRNRLDIWWDAQGGNIPLSLSLIRFITSADEWRRASVRFLIYTSDGARSQELHKTTTQLLAEARVDALVKVINAAIDKRPYEDWVSQESADADLTVIPLNYELDGKANDFIERTSAVISTIGSTLLIRGSSTFEQAFAVGKYAPQIKVETRDPEVETPPDSTALPEVTLPEIAALASEVRRFSVQHDALVSRFHEMFVEPVYAADVVTVDKAKTLVTKYFAQLEKALAEGNPRRKEKLVARAQSAFLFQSGKLLNSLKDAELINQQSAMWRGIVNFFEETESYVDAAPTTLAVVRPSNEYEPLASDSDHVRRFKQRHRFRARLIKGPPSYSIALVPLRAFYQEHQTQSLFHQVLSRYARHSYEYATELGKVLISIKTSLTQIGSRTSVDRFSEEGLLAEKERVLNTLEQLSLKARKCPPNEKVSLLVRSRELTQSFSTDLDAIDAHSRIRKERRIPNDARQLRTRLSSFPEVWRSNQSLVIERSALALRIAALQHRLSTIVQRTRNSLIQKIQNGILRECGKLLTTLKSFHEDIQSAESPRLKINHDFSKQFDETQVNDELVKELHAATSELPESLATISDESILMLSEFPFKSTDKLTVSLRQLLQSLIDVEFLAKIQEEMTKVSLAEQSAIDVAQDVIRLISLDLSDFEGTEHDNSVFCEHMTPIVESGMVRIEAELEELRAVVPQLSDHIDRQLESFLDQTDAYAITGSEETLRRYVRKQATEGESVFGRYTGIANDWIRSGFATLLYRRSAGMLLARRIKSQGRDPHNLVEDVLALVSQTVPSGEVLDELPFYYRQLFLGRTPITSAYWVGRTEEMSEAEHAIANYRRGFMGALMVIGERGSGKTALCRRIAATFFEPSRVHHLFPPTGGSIDPQEFKAVLEKELQFFGEIEEMFQTLTEGSVVVLHELELWWERSDSGAAVIELLKELIDKFSDRCFFILNCDVHSFHFINRLTAFSDSALAVIDCGPFDAEKLSEIITLRHRSTGLKFQLNGRSEDLLADWKLARLFNAYFDCSRGNIGTALQAWLTQVESVDGDTLVVSAPKAIDVELLEDLRMDWLAILLQLILHRQVTIERLERLTGISAGELRQSLETLVRMGLVRRMQTDVVEINRFVHHLLVTHLTERGLLA